MSHPSIFRKWFGVRVFAVHDGGGVISDLVTCPDDGPVAVLSPRPGMEMTEIEVPDSIDFDDPETLRAAVDGFIVERMSIKGTLIRN